MEPFAKDLLNSLKELKVIEEKELIKTFTECEKENVSFAEALIDHDLIDSVGLGRIIADMINVPYINLQTVSIPDSASYIIPEQLAKEFSAIVFQDNPDNVKIALANTSNLKLLEFIQRKVNKKVIPYFAIRRDIEQSLKIYKKDLQKKFDALLAEQVDILGDGKIYEAPIIKIVDLLIEYAYRNNASDIHIEPAKDNAQVRFRIDGIMHEVLTLSLEVYKQVVLRIKVLASLQTDEHASAQDGKIQVQLPEEDLDIRVSMVPVVHGEKAVLRLLASHFRQFSLSNLGMSKEDHEKVVNAMNKPYGMILSTGPTGSGKTTTMYAILKILNTPDKNIATIEDPVEYDVEGINQIQVNAKTNLTFAEGLRSILRQDPNIIYIGEIRDDETADIAINSALTGHIVLSTLHTNDAATAVPRFIDMGVEPFLVASTINVVIAQRLVRKICEKCKYSLDIELSELLKDFSRDLIRKIYGSKSSIRIYKGKGCSVCHMSGYMGRIGIFEVLEMNEAIRALIVQKADSDTIEQMAIKEGMRKMAEDGLEKIAEGITTIEEVLRATRE